MWVEVLCKSLQHKLYLNNVDVDPVNSSHNLPSGMMFREEQCIEYTHIKMCEVGSIISGIGRGVQPNIKDRFVLRFWKYTLKTALRKIDIDFLKLQLWTGSAVLGSMEWGRRQKTVQKCTLLNLSSQNGVSST